MLQLDNIALVQFKNYINHQFNFNERIVGICGSNGIGKTNLLDAIYFLCFTKSYFGKIDSMQVSRGYKGMRIEGNFSRKGSAEKIECIIRENNKKEFILNGDAYKKMSNHIGKFPAVFIAPDDVELITGNSDIRRKFLDTLLCQTDNNYLQQLITYNRVIQQRNSLLKTINEKGSNDFALLEILTDQLVKPGEYIYNFRSKFLIDFLPAVTRRYCQIAGTKETVQLEYNSQLSNNNFNVLLQNSLQKDIVLQRTNTGIHKDDINITLHNDSFKNTASQGQRKSLLFALKLQELEQLHNATGLTPILLLDDVFEKLDEGRMQNLLSFVCKTQQNQVFITDTHKERLEKSLFDLQLPFQIIELN